MIIDLHWLCFVYSRLLAYLKAYDNMWLPMSLYRLIRQWRTLEDLVFWRQIFFFFIYFFFFHTVHCRPQKNISCTYFLRHTDIYICDSKNVCLLISWVHKEIWCYFSNKLLSFLAWKGVKLKVCGSVGKYAQGVFFSLLVTSAVVDVKHIKPHPGMFVWREPPGSM